MDRERFDSEFQRVLAEQPEDERRAFEALYLKKLKAPQAAPVLGLTANQCRIYGARVMRRVRIALENAREEWIIEVIDRLNRERREPPDKML